MNYIIWGIVRVLYPLKRACSALYVRIRVALKRIKR